MAADVVDQDAAFNQLLGGNHGAVGQGQRNLAVKLLVGQVADLLGHPRGVGA